MSEYRSGFEIDLLPIGNGMKSGDCITFRYGNLFAGGDKQMVVLVDGGYGNNVDKLKKHLRDYYKCVDSDGKIVIDLVIVTHPDEDHVSGLAKLSEDEEVIIKNVWTHIPWKELNVNWFKDGRITSNSLEQRLESAFSSLLKFVSNTSSCKYLGAYGDIECNLGGKYLLLSPDSELYKKCIAHCGKKDIPAASDEIPAMKYPDKSSKTDLIEKEKYVRNAIKWDYDEGTSPINESSMVFIFQYLNYKILFTGDAGREALENAIKNAKERGIPLNDFNIIKMPHHGSRKNVTPSIMTQLKGTNTRCYISCVADDLGHHPSMRLVNMLKEKNFVVLSTSGSTLHWGNNAPDRGWEKADELPVYDEIEKRKNSNLK